jgi:cytochrome b
MPRSAPRIRSFSNKTIGRVPSRQRRPTVEGATPLKSVVLWGLWRECTRNGEAGWMAAIDDIGDPIMAFRSEYDATESATHHRRRFRLRCQPRPIVYFAAHGLKER